MTEDGKPYGPIRYKQIVNECYTISRIIHTSYQDVLKMTPTERSYILEFMYEEAQKKEALRKEIETKNKYKR